MPEVDSEDEAETDDESALQAAKKAASMAGEQGRAHKDVDSCYSFWIGAAIKVRQGDSTPLADHAADPRARLTSTPRAKGTSLPLCVPASHHWRPR
jgi:hypothetical protein